MANQRRTIPTLNNANYLDVLQKNGLSEDQFWSSTLQKMIVMDQSEFVFTKLAKKVSVPRNAGTKIWTTRRYLHLPVDLAKGQLAEGVAPTPMTVEGKTVSATFNQYGAYIEETDVAADIHFDNIMSIYQPELSRHAAHTIELDLIRAIEAEASVSFTGAATDVDTVTDVIDFEVLRRGWLSMKNALRTGHPLAGGKPIFVAHPNVLQDLLDDEAIVADLIIKPGYDEKIIKTGSIDQYTMYGVYLMESLVLEPKVNTAGKMIYSSFLVGGDSYVHTALGSNDVSWYKKGFVADSNDPLGQKSTLGYKLWTGGKVIDPLALRVIYSTSSFDDTLRELGTDVDGRPATQGLTAISTLAIRKNPKKVKYKVGEELDVEGLIAGYVDTYGSTVIIDNSELDFTYDFSAAGAANVDVTFVGSYIDANGDTVAKTITDQFEVTVTA